MVMEARPVEQTAPTDPQPWSRLDIDLYAIERGGDVVGYVEVAGPVFVALAGTRYDRAVEVRQTLTFQDAVRTLHRRGA